MPENATTVMQRERKTKKLQLWVGVARLEPLQQGVGAHVAENSRLSARWVEASVAGTPHGGDRALRPWINCVCVADRAVKRCAAPGAELTDDAKILDEHTLSTSRTNTLGS